MRGNFETLKYFKFFPGANQFAKNLSISKQSIQAMKLRKISSYFIDLLGSQKFDFPEQAIEAMKF